MMTSKFLNCCATRLFSNRSKCRVSPLVVRLTIRIGEVARRDTDHLRNAIPAPRDLGSDRVPIQTGEFRVAHRMTPYLGQPALLHRLDHRPIEPALMGVLEAQGFVSVG